MRYKSWIVGAGLACALVAAAPAGATILDISALNGTGATLALAAGTYTVSFVGIAGGGVYDAWSPWGNNDNCNSSGENCAQGFFDSITIDLGHGGVNFDGADATENRQLPAAGDSHFYATAAQALAAVQAGPLGRAPFFQASDPNAYAPESNPITFTLASAQAVHFLIDDSVYGDNRGGVSLSIDSQGGGTPGAPEPATWAMMLLGFGGLGARLRANRRLATA